jgi:hypothetical protein
MSGGSGVLAWLGPLGQVYLGRPPGIERDRNDLVGRDPRGPSGLHGGHDTGAQWKRSGPPPRRARPGYEGDPDRHLSDTFWTAIWPGYWGVVTSPPGVGVVPTLWRWHAGPMGGGLAGRGREGLGPRRCGVGRYPVTHRDGTRSNRANWLVHSWCCDNFGGTSVPHCSNNPTRC